jgi:hypothetical protein
MIGEHKGRYEPGRSGRGRGRPALSDAERRTHEIKVRLNDAERGELERRAHGAGYPELGAYLRRTVLAQRPPRAGTPAVNVRAWQELARTAGNLNQLTAHLNGGGRLDATGTARLADALEDMAAEVRALRAALIRGGAEDDEG